MGKVAVAIVILWLLVDAGSAQPNPELPVLRFGELAEKVIEPQEKHGYRVHLESGQYAKFDVRQTGCDVVLMVVGPDGKNLVEIRNMVEGEGVESASVAVETTGEYEFRVLSFGENKGSYAAGIAELRPASPAEISFTAGWKLQNEGIKLQAMNPTADAIEQAIGKFRQALEKFNAAQAVREQNAALHNIGTQYARLGQRQKAIEYFQSVLQRYRALGRKREESIVMESIGSIYKAQGKWQSALEYYAESIALAKEADVYVSRIASLAEIASIYEKLNDFDTAENYYLQSLDLARSIKSPMYMASAINGLGKVEFYRRNFAKALSHFQEAIEVEKDSKDHRNAARYINSVGRTYFALGEQAKSIEFFERSLNFSRQRGDKLDEAGTLRQLGNIHLETGEFATAEEYLAKSLQIYRQVEAPTELAETLFSLARVSQKLGKLDEAQTFQEESLQLIESFRANVNLSDLRDAFSARLSDYYGFYTELLVERHFRRPGHGFDRQAWLAGERGRARNLLNLLNESNADINQGVDAELLRKAREIYALLNVRLENLTRLTAGKSNPKQIEVLRREIDTIRTEYQLVQAKIRDKSPRYAALTQPEPVSLPTVQTELLDENSAIVSYSLGIEKSFLWFVTKNEWRVFELPKRSEIESAARKFYELLTERNRKVKFETAGERKQRLERVDGEMSEASVRLRDMLLGPVETALGQKRLLVIADGSLQYVPFAALKGRSGFLVETNEIVNLPSASALKALRTETRLRPGAPKTAMVLADPVFDVRDERFTFANAKFGRRPPAVATRSPEFPELDRSLRSLDSDDINIPRLIQTRREAEVIAALTPPSMRRIAVDFAATRQLALSDELGRYSIIHFATHGILNNKNPELSGLVLSLIDENGNPLNGFLRTDEVFNMKLSADLVVLSGCRTGLGKEIRGEGLIGLTRGFMYAGAARVLVSLWDVDDEATAELMTLFYRNLLGKKMPPAGALRAAQLAFLKDRRFANPYYSMAFTLHGEL